MSIDYLIDRIIAAETLEDAKQIARDLKGLRRIGFKEKRKLIEGLAREAFLIGYHDGKFSWEKTRRLTNGDIYVAVRSALSKSGWHDENGNLINRFESSRWV
jgi:hypothetical protein